MLRIALVASALALPSGAALARGPEHIADAAEQAIDAVVNISTTQKAADTRAGDLPKVPPGSPMEEFFEDFFKNRRGQQGENQPNRERGPRRANSLGSGFVIDASGLVVTNNHVIADAD
jgi:serine protease Do